MFKTAKLKSLLLTIAILGSFSVFSQEQDSVLSKQYKEEVSDTELSKFADSYVNLQLVNQEAQEELMALIEDEGLPIDRFNAIQKSNMEKTEVDATQAEIEMHASVTAKIKELQPKFEAKAMQSIEASGLSVEEFEKLVAVIQQDTALQKRLQTMVMQKQKTE